VVDRFTVIDMEAALLERRYPTVTLWNRLEGRPRTANFERALRAEVRDALWMLTRQWQTGEFRAEDAGSPVFAKVHLGTTQLSEFQAGDGTPEPIDSNVPLQAQAERLPPRLTIGADKIALDVRLMLGRRWLKLIAPIGSYADAFIDKYRFELPDPSRRDSAAICASAQVWQSFAAVAERAMDGGQLFKYLIEGSGRHAYDDIGVLEPDKQQALDDAADAFVAWVRRFFTHPSSADATAWRTDRLDYRFSCATPVEDGAKTFVADEYEARALDWHTFDVAGGAPSNPSAPAPNARATTLTRTLIPAPVRYSGMPLSRWWAIEDGRTNFGDIRPDTTDLAKLLFVEFGLIYSNDWFNVPFTLDNGTIASVKGLAVTNVFGERSWIEQAGSHAGDSWQRWDLFGLDVQGDASSSDASVMLLPTSPKVQESAPLAEVLFIRDEMANMVWGVERTIPAPDGGGRSGVLAGRETRAFHERWVAQATPAPAPAVLPNDARIRYQLMSTVPEHWIPFIPVHVGAGQRAIQLQRASVPRVIPGDPISPPAPVRPRTDLLRVGLDAGQPYFLPDEEVPRSGTRVLQIFRRARWHDGTVHIWLAARSEVGRGEGSSGLGYDRLIDKKADT
jgi:hypothetical protein